jgi:hypothetical protein
MSLSAKHSQPSTTDSPHISSYLRKKRLPTTLEELVKSGILKALPTDPFATDGKFLYRPQGTTYLLYSVGPDGKDDNGTPITNPNVPPARMKHQPFASSTGDIVLGMNVK